MTGPEGAVGAVLETMTWVALIPGIPMLLVGWILAARACKWVKTSAEVFEAGGFQGFRWSAGSAGNAGSGGGSHHSTLNEPSEVPLMDVGAYVSLYYDQCHPDRWRLARPSYGNGALLIGSILTGTGFLSIVAGFILMAW